MIFLLWNTAGSTTGFQPYRLQVGEKFLYPYFSDTILRCIHVLSSSMNISPCFLIASSKYVPRHWFRTAVSGFRILCFFAFQSLVGFRIPKPKIPYSSGIFFFWIPDFTCKNFPDSLTLVWESSCSYAGVISSHCMPFGGHLHAVLSKYLYCPYLTYVLWPVKTLVFPSPFQLLGSSLYNSIHWLCIHVSTLFILKYLWKSPKSLHA